MSYAKQKKAYLEGKGKLHGTSADIIIIDELVPVEKPVKKKAAKPKVKKAAKPKAKPKKAAKKDTKKGKK